MKTFTHPTSFASLDDLLTHVRRRYCSEETPAMGRIFLKTKYPDIFLEVQVGYSGQVLFDRVNNSVA